MSVLHIIIALPSNYGRMLWTCFVTVVSDNFLGRSCNFEFHKTHRNPRPELIRSNNSCILLHVNREIRVSCFDMRELRRDAWDARTTLRSMLLVTQRVTCSGFTSVLYSSPSLH